MLRGVKRVRIENWEKEKEKEWTDFNRLIRYTVQYCLVDDKIATN